MGRWTRRHWRRIAGWVSMATFGILLLCSCASVVAGGQVGQVESTPVGHALAANFGYSPVSHESGGTWWVICPNQIAANCTAGWHHYMTKDRPAVFVATGGSTITMVESPDNFGQDMLVKQLSAKASKFSQLAISLQLRVLNLARFCLENIGGNSHLAVTDPSLGTNLGQGTATCQTVPSV
jgi:hypothetical protein